MKRIISILTIFILPLIFAGCALMNNQNHKQIYGKVTEVNGYNITLDLGELEEAQNENQPSVKAPSSPVPNNDTDNKNGESSNEDKMTSPEKPPEISNNPNGEDSQGNQPPELPSGDSTHGNEPPDLPSGDNTQSNQPPTAPGGQAPDSFGFTDMPENGRNSSSDNSNGVPSIPPGSNGSQNNFKANGESKTYNFENVPILEQTGSKTEDATVESIKVDSILKLEIDDNQNVLEATVINENLSGPENSQIDQGSSANTISNSQTLSDKTYTSTGDDENALRIDSGEVTLNNIKVDKSAGSSSNLDNGNFYGLNAALLITNGATATIDNSEVHSSAQNGNGIFSYGTGTTTNINNTKITTEKDNSGGIQTTGGATTNATNLTVKTAGDSSASIRSDRGGGNVNVSGGSYTSSGLNSPAVYSTANIKINGATLKANNSESLVIEGKNSIELNNCDVTGNMDKTKSTSSDINVHNVMIYQSMSGDADVGTASFSMKNGNLTGLSGDMFYITNTKCNINLENVNINNQDTGSYLMKIAGNNSQKGWGKAGSNGGEVECTTNGQTLNGNVEVDTISKLNLTLNGNSTLTGTINVVENQDNGTAVSDNAVITINEGSTWNLTGDCKITSLNNNGTINFNGFTITLADGTILK